MPVQATLPVSPPPPCTQPRHPAAAAHLHEPLRAQGGQLAAHHLAGVTAQPGHALTHSLQAAPQAGWAHVVGWGVG
jgi:hypothetical protein